MGTTMRADTKLKMYQQYMEAYEKALSTGNLKGFNLNGITKYDRPMNKDEFDYELNKRLANMSSKDNKKYQLGNTIFNDYSAKYTKKQFTHLRREVAAQLESTEGVAGSELKKMLKDYYYKSGGKFYIKREFFDMNIVQIMDLFFAAGGSIGDS